MIARKPSVPMLGTLVLFALVPFLSLAQERDSAVQADPGVGGPQTIGAQLEIDNTPGDYRFPVVVFADWFKHKQRINDQYGIGYNINYTTSAIWASEKSAPENEDFAASGILNALFSWKLIGSDEEGNVGRFFAKLDWRHKFTTVAPHFLSFEAGYNSLAAVGFKDYTPRLQEFDWAQAFLEHVAASDLKKIAVVSSLSGSIQVSGARGGLYFYNVSKAGVNMALRMLGSANQQRGVVVAILHPGGVNTRMLAQAGAAGRGIEPEESVAGMIEVIDALDAETSGTFQDYRGRALPW